MLASEQTATRERAFMSMGDPRSGIAALPLPMEFEGGKPWRGAHGAESGNANGPLRAVISA
jgi:hypothetical protein